MVPPEIWANLRSFRRRPERVLPEKATIYWSKLPDRSNKERLYGVYRIRRIAREVPTISSRAGETRRHNHRPRRAAVAARASHWLQGVAHQGARCVDKA